MVIIMLIMILVLVIVCAYQQIRLVRLEKKCNVLSHGQYSGDAMKSGNVTCYFSKYAVVRYDAFETIKGKMSFVIAVLSEENNGLLINSMQSRDNNHCYIKEIIRGEAQQTLSEEETEALQKALGILS